MAQLTLKAQRQIQTDLLVQLLAELGLNDANPGSVLDILTNAIAQEDFAQYVNMAQIARLVDLDAITGDDLDTKAFEYGITRRLAQKATGKIDILRPAGFEKVSTTFYAGEPAPILGDSVINVNDASNPLIGSSGTLILGRGTTNEEEVSYSAAPVNNTNFFTFTLDAPLTKNHAVEETVILKQGNNETILAGTQVRVESTGVDDEILFTINNDITLLAGEDKVTGVDVTAVKAGARGNIAIKAIEGAEAFTTAPFPGARAENTNRFSTGRNRETDDQLRDRIRDSVQSLSRGVKQAILNAIVGLVDPETAKRVVSATIILPQDECGDVVVYIDDGTGFEPTFLSLGFEDILASAAGGERRLQLDIQPLVKAQVENNISEPYNMTGTGKTLTVNVGTESETITFVNSDFSFPDSATAEGLVTAINNKSDLLEARTSQTGTRVTLQAKRETNEDIQVTGGTANPIIGFPTDARSTLYLYVNDVLQSKDGKTAFIDSGNQATYNFSAIGAFPHTLTLVIDKKSANPQTVTFQAADFSDTTSITALEIVTIINQQLAGATASLSDNGTRIRIASNTELSTDSAVEITGGSANDATNGLNFNTTAVIGIDGDYTLNRETGTIELKEPLPVNATVTAGSKFTRASLRAGLSENYSPANGSTLVVAVDGGADQTVTFDGTFSGGINAQGTADFINAQLNGATAIVREIGILNFIEIRTNSYEEGIGSIEIKSSSTANGVFGFTEDTVATNQRPHKAFRVSSDTGPYEFREGDSLVTIMNNDIVNSTFSIVMDFDGEATGVTSASVFQVNTYGTVFPNDDDLNGFYVAFTDGPTTVTGTGTDVTDQGSNIWRIEFDSLPTGLANIQVGDLVKTSGFAQASNNGFFLVTAVDTAGNGYIEIENASGVAETGATGTVLMSQKREISDYTSLTGEITVSSAFSASPVVGNNVIVIPRTVNNVVDYMNNIRISSLSLKAIIEGVEQNTKIQVSSKLEGSDGYVQITGGKANDILGFNTEIYRGLQGYIYYTGLLELVHKTIYGDDTDLTSFPGIGAAGILFRVKAPTVREVPVSVNVTLREGISIASRENEIKSAISEYIQGLGVGQNIIIERIRSRVIQIPGVIDVVLNDPTSNIAIADNEKASTRNSLITVG